MDDELTSLMLKARAWQAEASTAPIHLRRIYERMADAYAQLAARVTVGSTPSLPEEISRTDDEKDRPT